MVEYLSTIGDKTLNISRRSFGFSAFLKKFRLPILIILSIAFLVFLAVWAQSGISQKPTAKINQSFSTQARTEDKIRVRDADLLVTINGADIDNSLLIQGKRARTREGKTFLIINMEVENEFQVPLYIFPVDLLRLVRDDGKKIAPSVHQGTVEIRPISTKKSNVGFVIDPDEKNFKLEIGELSGEKQLLEMSFKQIMVDEYSTSEISEKLVSEIKEAIGSKEYGSVEIYIESGRVVQITERVIRKKIKLNGNEDKNSKVVYWRPIKNRK